MYWNAWDGASQFRLFKVSLKDTAHAITNRSVSRCVQTSEPRCINQIVAGKNLLQDQLWDEDSHRKYAQQLLSVGDVWYCRLRAVQEAKEDAPSMSSVPVNFLCRLLGQTTHCMVHPAREHRGCWLCNMDFYRETITATLTKRWALFVTLCLIIVLQFVVSVPLLITKKLHNKSNFQKVKKLCGMWTLADIFNTHRFGERISGALLATSNVTSIRLVIAASLTLRHKEKQSNKRSPNQTMM